MEVENDFNPIAYNIFSCFFKGHIYFTVVLLSLIDKKTLTQFTAPLVFGIWHFADRRLVCLINVLLRLISILEFFIASINFVLEILSVLIRLM